MRNHLTRAVLALLYLGFFGWYTSCSGPLTAEEIAHYVSILEKRGAPAEQIARMRDFLESDTGDDFAMMNVIEMREPPTPIEGVSPGDSAQDVLARYMEYMWPALLSRACHPVLFGSAAAETVEVWGVEATRTWSQAGLMRYRSRRDLMEIATNPEFSGPHEFKIAAMEKTIAFPVDPWFHLGDPRVTLALLFAIIGLSVRRRGRSA